MYGNGTFDFDGPERLPPTMAVTRIKQKQVPKATYSDPIVISSSSSDGGPCVIPAKKKGGNAAIEGKKKAIVTLDSSDDEVDIVDGNEHSLPVVDINESLEEDYQDVAKSCKHKAKKPVPAINSTQSNKDDGRKRPTKGVKKFKSAKYVEVSDSDTDKTVQARQVTASKVHPACEKDLFDGAASTSETAPNTVPRIFLPLTPKELHNTSTEQLLKPSSPSPKHHVPLAPLTEFDTSRRSPENDATVAAPCKVAGSVPTIPSAQVAVEPQAPSMPLCEAAVPHASVPTEILTTTGTVAGVMVPLANPTSFPPTTVVPSLPPQNLCDKRFTYSDWMNQTRQVGGGHSSHAFHPSQPPFISYHENDVGMIAPTQMQRRAVGMQRAMYLNSGAYPEDIYGGDV
ncbi:hypothetical protein JVU11DRAFT_10184 [Chiua virens]|nr:hypothetical protein JVU11DRAFT_10184 [Chiua virens]